MLGARMTEAHPDTSATDWLTDPEAIELSPASRLIFARKRGLCGWCPYPNQGGYSHWYCQRKRRHLGRHRYRNYVFGRLVRSHTKFRPVTYKGQPA